MIINYRAFGYSIRSEIPLTELALSDGSPTDIDIQWGKVAFNLPSALKSRPHFDITRKSILLRIDQVGRFLIEQGRRITIQPDPTADHDSIRLYLLGSAFGAVLQQRKRLALHASAVTDGKSCILLCGRSGQGKSTTACALMQQGYQLLSDDVCAVEVDNCEAILHPAYPQLKLWRQTMEYLNFSHYYPKNLQKKIVSTLDKYALPAHQQFHTRAMPLKAVIWLTSNSVRHPTLQVLSGGRSFNAIRKNIYRKKYLTEEALNNHFKLSAQLLSLVPVYQLSRPVRIDSIRQVSELVTELFEKPLHQKLKEQKHADHNETHFI